MAQMKAGSACRTDRMLLARVARFHVMSTGVAWSDGVLNSMTSLRKYSGLCKNVSWTVVAEKPVWKYSASLVVVVMFCACSSAGSVNKPHRRPV